MKSKLNFLALTVMSLFVMTSCGKDDIPTVVSKNVVYEIRENEASEVAERIFLEGSYMNSNGLMMSFSEKLDWKKEIKNVPANVKLGFNGELKGDKLKKIDVTISMIITDAKTGRVLQQDEKVVRLIKDVVSGEGLTAVELKEKTKFSFKEE